MKLQIKLLLSASLITIVGINACKKDSTETINTTNITTKKCKIETIYINDTLSDKFFYNANNQLVKQFSYNRNGIVNDSSVIVYNSTTVVIKQLGRTSTYTIGANGYASSVIDSYVAYNDTTTFTYDNNGYLIKSETGNHQITNSVIMNENIVSQEHISDTGTSYYYYEYSDKLDIVGISNSFVFYSFLLGKSSKNLIKKETYNNKGNTSTQECDWTVENGLPAKAKLKRTQNGVIESREASFNYLCK